MISTTAQSAGWLDVHNIGVFHIRDGESKYTVSGLKISYSIGSIPAATVTVGSGVSISNASDVQDPYVLMEKILSSKKGLYPIEIYEDDTLIFKGKVVACSPYMRTGTATVQALNLVCMHPAVDLMAAPMSSFRYISGAKLNAGYLTKNDADATANVNTGVYRNTDFDILSRAVSGSFDYSTPLIKGISDILLQIQQASTGDIDITGRNRTVGINVSDYVDCKYRLNPEFVSEEYYMIMAQNFLSYLTGNTIFSTLTGTLDNNEYLLKLVPGDMDKLELICSNYWVSEPELVLHGNEMDMTSASWNLMGLLNEPDALVVDFGSLVNWTSVPTGDAFTSFDGFYPPELRDQIRNWDSETAKENPIFKWNRVDAPSWMLGTMLSRLGIKKDSKGQPSGAEEANTPSRKDASSSTANDSQDTTKKTIDTEQLRSLADQYAKAVFVSTYRTSHTFSVNLLLSTRHYGLESKVGKLIGVELVTGDEDNKLNVKGILQQLTFQYSYGSPSNASYNMTLCCVRPYNDDTNIECPLYIRSSET